MLICDPSTKYVVILTFFFSDLVIFHFVTDVIHFRDFVPADRGSCGHLKTSWDNHTNCLSCSSCSRFITCSVYKNWLTLMCVLAKKRRLHSFRHATMAKTKTTSSKKYSKKKDPEWSEDILSDIHGNTTLHGYTAWCRKHTGCSSTDEHVNQSPGTRQSTSPGTRRWRHRSPVTRHQAPGNECQSSGTRYRSPGSWPPGTSHQAPVTRHQSPGTRQWALVSRHSWNSDQSLNNEHQSSTNRQRLLLPLEPAFLSDPSFRHSEPPRNTWDSHRSASKTRSSRKDLPSSKHKKRRR